MKIRRYKKVNRNLNFFMTNFGFRKPYQLLTDGTFCLAALNNKVNIANDIPKYLQGEVKLITTSCAIVEMENLGPKLNGALAILKNYVLHKCGHENKNIPGFKCILSMVSNGNPNHYMVCTQDRDLQEKVRSLPGVPLIFLHMKTPTLEQPSEVSVKKAHDKTSNLAQSELDKLNELKEKEGLLLYTVYCLEPVFISMITRTIKYKAVKGHRISFNCTLDLSEKVSSVKAKMLEDLKDTMVESKVQKLTYWGHISIGTAEFLGTTFLVFLSCLGACRGMQGDGMSSMHASFAAGLAVTVAIQIFAHISGAHVNPAVTLNALIVKQIGWYHLPTYLLSQVLGSLSGASLFVSVTNTKYLEIPDDGNGVCVNAIHDDLTVFQGLLVEILLSIILNLAICSSWDARNSDKLDSVSLKIGLLVVVLNLGGAVYTGASMNPCRSFGPAVLSGDYTNHWVYWIGPIVGAAIAAVTYRVLYLKNFK
ncbi:hypothetical protein ABEB36_002468 [Hypothenemus hampei]|uniref:rRNA-processing protein UTP23 homolog n=1 Tax=Hypothenemus hampei TaxID=57062 RepID=A0ABD1F5X7_HYPHA